MSEIGEEMKNKATPPNITSEHFTAKVIDFKGLF